MYFGGSGGFFLLHLLILSNKFFCAPLNNFQQVFDKQWNITDPAAWKLLETWPDNHATSAAATDLHKLFFHCNGGTPWKTHTGNKILLYTDIDTQLSLARYKHAWCFHPSFLQGRDPEYMRNQVLTQTTNLDGHWVWHQIADVWDTADQCIRLQDLVTNCPKVLASLGIEYTVHHEQFIKHWLRLHTPELQTLLTKS